MSKLLVLCCVLVGGHAFSLKIHPQDVARNIPARCVQKSVTPVSCTNLPNSDELLAHPDDCQLFYSCEVGRAQPTCRECPAGLHFNPTLHVCDWAQSAGCTAQASTTTTPWLTSSFPNNTTDSILNSTYTTISSISNVTATSPPSTVTRPPPANVTLPRWPTTDLSNTTNSPKPSSITWSPPTTIDDWLLNSIKPWRPATESTTTTNTPDSNNTNGISSTDSSTALESSTSRSETSSESKPIFKNSDGTEAPAAFAPTARSTRHTTVGWKLLN